MKKKKKKDEKSSNEKKTLDGPFLKPKKMENKSKTKELSEEEKKKEKEKEREKNSVSNKFVNVGKIYQMNILNRAKTPVKTNFHSSMLDNLKTEGELQDYVMDYKKYKELISSAK